MAIAGNSTYEPATRVYIHNRKLKLGLIHNVPKEVLFTPEQAAAYLDDNPNAYIYVFVSQYGGTIYLAELLEEMGLTGIPDDEQWRGG